MANPVSHRAVMVALNIRSWKGSAGDREVAAQAEIHASAEQGTMTVIKQLTPPYLIQPIKTITALGRQEHYKLTMPGMIKGQALLPTKMFETYMMVHQELGEQYFTVVDKFVDIYPETKERAKVKLGTAYKDRDFPSVHAIRSYFDYKVHPSPIPEVGDWRLEGIDPKEVSHLRSEVEDSVKQMYHQATEEMFGRARDALENLHRQAKNYNAKHPGASLGDATIDQMREFAEMVCDMNITGDPLLDKIGKEMLKDFVDLKGVELRKSAEMRTDIANKAQRILDKMVQVKRVAA